MLWEIYWFVYILVYIYIDKYGIVSYNDEYVVMIYRYCGEFMELYVYWLIRLNDI